MGAKWKSVAGLSALLASFTPSNSHAVGSPVLYGSNSPGCQALQGAGLGSLLLFPNDTAYAARESSYWATNVPQGPLCIVQPKTTSDVSAIVKTLTRTTTKFAVRSGGHMQWTGANDIGNGVTIDLGLMGATTYNATTGLVSIEPGQRWRDVYAVTEPLGVMVTGGRDADVGVGGFLTGGGNSFYVGRTGWGCDTVVNFEIVLADGSIVQANKNTNSDLWKALKGGQGNFGIVTRFDVTSVEAKPIWGGMLLHNQSYIPELATALSNFNTANKDHRDDAHLSLTTYNSLVPGDTVVASLIANTQTEVNSSAFDEVVAVPAISRDIRTRGLGSMVEQYTTPGGSRISWRTLTFHNDPSFILEAQRLHRELIATLSDVLTPSGFYTQCIFQPIPAYFADNSVARGGNVMGMDSVKTDSLLWLGVVGYQNASADQAVHAASDVWTRRITDFVGRQNANVDWLYINYADKSQNPLRHYGKANLNFLKAVAAKYDPKKVFQLQSPSGFRLVNA